MNSTQELIQLLRVRTVMYIGQQSVIRLAAFIHGFFFAVYHREKNNEMSMYMNKFTLWLASQNSIKEVLGWDSILLRLANNDDEAAFHLFWEKWDEFCNERDTESE